MERSLRSAIQVSPAMIIVSASGMATGGRVLQMDCVNPPDCDPAVNPAKAAWKKIGVTPRSTDLAIEVEIS